jgi:hypothetical protein
MRPSIDGTEFGSITIAGEVYEHDVVIRLSGNVKKRKKKLSKAKYGTSHGVTRRSDIFDAGATRLILGSGQYGSVRLSEEAAAYFRTQGCAVQLLPTPHVVTAGNAATGAVIGMFHVPC